MIYLIRFFVGVVIGFSVFVLVVVVQEVEIIIVYVYGVIFWLIYEQIIVEFNKEFLNIKVMFEVLQLDYE